jgi:hypothetical protein
VGRGVKTSEIRTAAATIVAATVDITVAVVDHIPDQVAVPCVMVGWRDPWQEPETMCTTTVLLELIVVAQRIEPGGQYELLEEISDALRDAFRAAPDFQWVGSTAPYPMTLAKIDYLAASLNLSHTLED